MRCEQCNRQLDSGALGDLCPVCLLDAALPEDGLRANDAFGYDLIEEIGRGGMGVVYRAVQHGSQRQVAVKMILAEQAGSPGAMERFRSEVEAVASLDHPNILPVYEAGETDGMPFYSLKFAEGGTLRERIAEFHGKPREAARVIATVARAVHHAHERGILHRDLKPGNILLDGEARTPFVADFGLAKWLGRDNRLTIASTALGTPNYIAPEQASGASGSLTTAADIYSLGAMLYELLAGRPPFVADTPLETLKLVAETAAPALRSIAPAVPRDLEVICLKCLAREPASRYSSAAALAGDLERWLEGLYDSGAARFKARATLAMDEAKSGHRDADDRGCNSAPGRGNRLNHRRAADRRRARPGHRRREGRDRKAVGSYLDQARASRLAGRRFDALNALEKATQIHRTAAVRDGIIAALALVDFKSGQRWARPASLYWNAAFDGTLEHYVVEAATGQLSVRRVADHEEVARLRGPSSPLGMVHGFSPGARYLAAKFLDDFTWIWELASGRVVLRVKGQLDWTNGDTVFSPDNRIVAVTQPREGVVFYRLDQIPPDAELDATQPWRRWDDAPFCHRLVFNPAGTHLAMVDVGDAARVGGREGIFQVRAIEDGTVTFEHRKPVGYGHVDWSPDGTLVAASSWDHHVYVHDAASGRVRHVLRGHLGTPVDVRFSHNGQWLASVGFDNSLRLWDVQSGALLARATGSDLRLQFSRDDRRLAVSFPDSAIGWLEIAPAEVFQTLHPPRNGDRPWALAASRDGRLLASSGDAGVQIWDLSSRQHIDLPPGGAGERISICFAADDGALLASYRDSGLHRWPLQRADGKLEIGERESLSPPADAQCLMTDISADGRRLAVSYLGKDYISLLPVEMHGPPRQDFSGHPNAFQVVLSPDGRWVASGTRTTGGVRVWNTATGEPAIDLEPKTEARPIFSSDSKWLLTSSTRGYQFWTGGLMGKGAADRAGHGRHALLLCGGIQSDGRPPGCSADR